MSERHEGLEDLDPTIPPPPDLEDRVVGALAERELVTRSGRGVFRRPWGRAYPLAAAAAAVALLVTGTVVGRATAPAATARAEFLLLMYQGPEFEPYTDANYAERFDDFSHWIAELRTGGHFVGGEQLDSSGVVIVPTPPATRDETRLPSADDGWIDGVLMINAADYDEAVAIARDSPHVRYGGRIAVRRVSPT